MDADQRFLLSLVLGIGLLSLILEFATRRRYLPQWLGRKILHILAVGSCAVAPYALENIQILTGIVVVAEGLLVYLVGTGKLFSEAGGRKSWGIALFPLAYLFLLVLFPEQRFLIVLPMGLLAISDAAAAIAGNLLARRYYVLTGDKKSWVGNLAFFLTGSGFLWAGSYLLLPASDFSANWITWMLVVAGISTLLEALGTRGWDNIWVPIGSALLLWLGRIDRPDLLVTLAILLLALPFVWVTIRKKILTPGGAWIATLLGLWVALFSGLIWLVPLALFLGSSSLLGRLFPSRFTSLEEKHGQPRDEQQVLANGGLYGLLATLFPVYPELAGTGMLLSMAIATADTWSSEVGIYFRGATYDVLRWKRLPAGVSGGISWQGSFAGLLGALLIALLVEVLPAEVLSLSGWHITWLGFAGMWFDSLLGAGFQAKYAVHRKAEWQDRPAPDQQLVAGWAWMTNDRVNWIANGTTTLLTLMFLHLYSGL